MTRLTLVSITTVLIVLSILILIQPTQVRTSYTLVPMTVRDLAQTADNILIGKVSKILSSVAENNRVWTDVVVEVERYLKDNSTNRVTARLSGGRTLQVEEKVAGEVVLNEGERVLLFIKKEPNTVWGDNYFIHGLIQGKYLLKNGLALNQDPSRSTTEKEFIDEIMRALNEHTLGEKS